jgi:molecular chaperone HscB
VDHFEFYGIPVAFHPDDAAIKRIFYANSKKYHPDFHTQATDEEQDQVLEMASRNNEAFKVLSDADRRMRYILEINQLLGDESSNPTLPQAFLMEMMDINEALMELEFDFDAAKFQTILNELDSYTQQLEKSVEPYLSKRLEDADSRDTLIFVKNFYLKKRYLLRIKENLRKFASA